MYDDSNFYTRMYDDSNGTTAVTAVSRGNAIPWWTGPKNRTTQTGGGALLFEEHDGTFGLEMSCWPPEEVQKKRNFLFIFQVISYATVGALPTSSSNIFFRTPSVPPKNANSKTLLFMKRINKCYPQRAAVAAAAAAAAAAALTSLRRFLAALSRFWKSSSSIPLTPARSVW